ncbi:hypothetical protein RvY_09453 [Ramazzottius varieornatus]|uniref:Uncharacterized protein n=1 Tax=Ramazzottius varieornatus TaxID=947166 RepID=A0A1D1V9D6_RAMVA|nr:hypothetical protein RvY_09453 [Ramazzottius varieornatus]
MDAKEDRRPEDPKTLSDRTTSSASASRIHGILKTWKEQKQRRLEAPLRSQKVKTTTCASDETLVTAACTYRQCAVKCAVPEAWCAI